MLIKREMGTKVTKPVNQVLNDGYDKCPYCKKWWTSVGVNNHIMRCPKRPKKVK